MNYKNKYEAAADFDAGVKKGLFLESPSDGFKWEDQTEIFMAGYRYGRSMKDLMTTAKNECLLRFGISQIEVIALAGQDNADRQ